MCWRDFCKWLVVFVVLPGACAAMLDMDFIPAAPTAEDLAVRWYYQNSATLQKVGPWTVAQLCNRVAQKQIDGCTPVWRHGLDKWQQFSDVQELKVALRSTLDAATQSADHDDEEEDEVDEIVDDTGDVVVVAAVPEKRRPALEEIPMTHTFTSPQGLLYVYDVIDKDWKICEAYEALLSAAGVGAGEDAAGVAAPLSTDEAMFLQLLEETADADTSAGPVPKQKPKPGPPSKPKVVATTSAVDADAAAEEAVAAGIDAECDEETLAKRQKKREYRERKKLKKQAGLFVKSKENPNVYVSGLPSDVTFAELVEVFKRAGVLKIDPDTGEPKIRIYEGPDGRGCKGDALITYANSGSVELAVKFLHEHELRPKCTLCVQQADFVEPERGPKLSKEELEKLAATRKAGNAANVKKFIAAKNAQKEAVGWGQDTDDGTGRRIVVLKHMYTLEEAVAGGNDFYIELADEIGEEAARIGQVLKVTPIEGHKLGVVCIKFKTSAEAEECIRVMDGRFFGGQTVEASFYDGVSDLRALGGTIAPPGVRKEHMVAPVATTVATPAPEAPTPVVLPDPAIVSLAHPAGKSGSAAESIPPLAGKACAESNQPEDGTVGTAGWNSFLDGQSSDSDDDIREEE